jgi:uncharacterized protein (TIGR00296 family)
MFTDDDGEKAVRIARTVIESHVKKMEPPQFEVPDIFRRKSGVFVTITTYPENQLRGCIGYPEPVMPLIDAIKDSAVSACSRDPRFPPVRREELKNLRVEVSLLTPPEQIKVKKPGELVASVEVGRHGLVMERGSRKGLLLPQVPVEWGWDTEEFLSQTCMKAGLLPDSWLQEGTICYKFEAEVFSEEKPGGPVKRRELGEEHGSSD